MFNAPVHKPSLLLLPSLPSFLPHPVLSSRHNRPPVQVIYMVISESAARWINNWSIISREESTVKNCLALKKSRVNLDLWHLDSFHFIRDGVRDRSFYEAPNYSFQAYSGFHSERVNSIYQFWSVFFPI